MPASKFGLEADSSTLIPEGRDPSNFKPVVLDRKNAGLTTFEEHAITPFPVPATSVTFDSFKPEFLNGLKKKPLGRRIQSENHGRQ